MQPTPKSYPALCFASHAGPVQLAQNGSVLVAVGGQVFQTDELGMTSAHPFSSSLQDMERVHGRRARRYAALPR
jgi:hypothetical protein